MESTCVDTSLNLNVVPSLHMADNLVEELHRLNCENKRLAEKLTHMCESYQAMQNQLSKLMNTNFERKRKAESESCINMLGVRANITTECSSTINDEDSSFKRPKDNIITSPKVSKVLVKTEASNTSLYVMDGYQWRKYGQKVTRDNPSPRAYFRCSFAPRCPVKKKVQRSLEDPTILVATYEGEHNHGHERAELSMVSSRNDGAVGSVNGSTRGPTIRVDLVQSGLVDSAQKSSIEKFLVQQMATSLTRDPNFTTALATAISGRILDQTSVAKW